MRVRKQRADPRVTWHPRFRGLEGAGRRRQEAVCIMRRIFSLGLTGLASAGFVALAIVSAKAGPSILFDVKTGQVIESDNPHARWYPASLTKLMTTYVAFRAVQSGEVTFLLAGQDVAHRRQRTAEQDGLSAGHLADPRQCAEDHHGQIRQRCRRGDRRKPRRVQAGVRGPHERRIAAARHDRLALGQRARPA